MRAEYARHFLRVLVVEKQEGRIPYVVHLVQHIMRKPEQIPRKAFSDGAVVTHEHEPRLVT